MTTKVTVEANHGWPVRVEQLDPKTGEPIPYTTYTLAGSSKRDFYVHDGADIFVHEIQPGEGDNGPWMKAEEFEAALSKLVHRASFGLSRVDITRALASKRQDIIEELRDRR